ncbi:GGDEF domain-containing protein [Sporosarcina sp. E16_8]|nr:GGDEF domain-containing protein [Sporosarcina sp. E16_8]
MFAHGFGCNQQDMKMNLFRKNVMPKAYKSLQQLLKEVESKKSELEFINEKLEVLALTDSLTGLNNRRYFEEQLVFFIELHRVTGRPFSLLAIDVDHFKRVNDSLGHPIGDLVL